MSTSMTKHTIGLALVGLLSAAGSSAAGQLPAAPSPRRLRGRQRCRDSRRRLGRRSPPAAPTAPVPPLPPLPPTFDNDFNFDFDLDFDFKGLDLDLNIDKEAIRESVRAAARNRPAAPRRRLLSTSRRKTPRRAHRPILLAGARRRGSNPAPTRSIARRANRSTTVATTAPSSSWIN